MCLENRTPSTYLRHHAGRQHVPLEHVGIACTRKATLHIVTYRFRRHVGLIPWRYVSHILPII
jgi:hypothetical protein